MEFVKKEVNFHNDKVFTVMKDGKLYVGASNICNNLGMTLGMKNRQVQNLQNDLVLSRGCIKFGAGVFDDNNQTLAIEIEFLPIWLAKIRITQNMLDEKQELVEKLIDYQLHCKDILADEFFGKRNLIQINEDGADMIDREIIQRMYRLIKKKDSVINSLVDIALDYDWIKYRAEMGFDKIKNKYQEMKQKAFMLDGKELSLEDIDNLNADQRKEILRKLEKIK